MTMVVEKDKNGWAIWERFSDGKKILRAGHYGSKSEAKNENRELFQF